MAHKEVMQDGSELDELATTPAEDAEAMKEYQGDILSAIMDMAEFAKKEEHEVEIRRNGVIMLRFKIHPLAEEEYTLARKKNTKYKTNKRYGMRTPDELNTPRYRSQLVYMATADEDKKRIWDNKDAWEKLGVASGVDMVDSILKAGEKDRILELLDQISGYGEDLEELEKN